NANVGADAITFNIPGSGVHTIAPLSALPAITDPLTIDGASQPGYAAVPRIEITGTSAGLGVGGLTLSAGPSVVRALIINGFSGSGVVISGIGSAVVE